MTRRNPWFSFLVHPRNVADLDHYRPFQILREYSSSEDEFLAKTCTLPPLVIGEVLFGFAPIRGEVVSVMRMPNDMTGAGALKATMRAVELAVLRGSRVIGLGELTSPITGAGMSVLKHLPAGVTLTSGSAYTAAIVRHNVNEVATALGLGSRARVAVVGCTGSVGVPASHLLAEDGFKLILVGRSVERVQHLLGGITNQATFAENMNAVLGADIVVLLTSDPTAQLNPDHVSPGAVVIDFAQPPNVSSSAYVQFHHKSVTVVEGGIVRIPDYSCTYDFGMPTCDAFACLAETYLFAREGLREHSVGRPSVETARSIDNIANKYRVYPRPLGISDRAFEPATL